MGTINRKNENSLTGERLRSIVHYDPETGVFTWTKSKKGIAKGGVAGCVHRFGYRLIGINNIKYRAHRLVWLYMTGSWPKEFLDHKNGIRDDNRFCNLREATMSENNRNMSMRSDNNSGFRGVSKIKSSNKWQSNIHINSKQIYLGSFNTPQDAHEAYKIAAIKYHGEFASY